MIYNAVSNGVQLLLGYSTPSATQIIASIIFVKFGFSNTTIIILLLFL
jgi:hypothetical protein